VVQDVLSSGFDSAGQRCSALRVLCLQREIAEPVLELLKAAMRELVIGDPARLATDIGPVIDAAARDPLLAHIERMRSQGRAVHQLSLPESCAHGCFVPPTLIEIESPAELRREVFGPVVHVLRYDASALGELVAAINATGYGLTLGIHSRIDATVDFIVAQARVGNIYVNRNMIGAVVGVQPFGGEGLSGTGPKAGGPLTLHRLAGTPIVTPAMLGAAPATVPPALERLAEWAAGSGRPWLAGLCADYGKQSLLGIRLVLPGPTGEKNTLGFAPRGRLLCLADSLDGTLAQLAAAFATGNTPVLADDARGRETLALLPDALAGLVGMQAEGDCTGLAGALTEAAAGNAVAVRLAACDGPLRPTVRASGTPPCYPLFRLLNERVVSVNTAAAGGNATLLSLGA
jgi:RHH-type proline utilization regulon transcriptional repressor/proline dehydrogenase/delta 1-pyrroline-5-carboxylate dehydrogenase